MMQLITLTERELDALEGETSEVWKMYIILRRLMDFQTGLVGAESGVSLWGLRRSMQVAVAQGRHRDESGVPTEKTVRHKIDRLISIGLVERRTIARKIVFFLPKSHRALARLKKVGQIWGRQAGQSSAGGESLDASGFDEVYPQEVGQTKNGEVGHISGIRLTPISEYKQQHTARAVDNFACDGSGVLQSFEMVDWLKRAEKDRGKVVSLAADQDAVKSWVFRGVTLNELSASYALAVADRDKNGNPAPLNAGFINIFIERVLSKRTPWFKSWSGIEETGAALGIEKRSGEHPQEFKVRVYAAAGISEEEVRQWQA